MHACLHACMPARTPACPHASVTVSGHTAHTLPSCVLLPLASPSCVRACARTQTHVLRTVTHVVDNQANNWAWPVRPCPAGWCRRYLASDDAAAEACSACAAAKDGADGADGAGASGPPTATSSGSSSAPQQLEAESVSEERALHGLLPPWPLLDAAAAGGLRSTLLGCFASEGDNAADGMALARHAGRLLLHKLVSPGGHGLGAGEGQGAGAAALAGALAARALRAPASWVGLYGRSFPREIF